MGNAYEIRDADYRESLVESAVARINEKAADSVLNRAGVQFHGRTADLPCSFKSRIPVQDGIHQLEEASFYISPHVGAWSADLLMAEVKVRPYSGYSLRVFDVEKRTGLEIDLPLRDLAALITGAQTQLMGSVPGRALMADAMGPQFVFPTAMMAKIVWGALALFLLAVWQGGGA